MRSSRVEAVVKRDRATRTIGLTFEIREGPKVFVERIGHHGQRPHARQGDSARVPPGRGAMPSHRQAAALTTAHPHLGFFKKSDVQQRRRLGADKTVIQVNVEEAIDRRV